VNLRPQQLLWAVILALGFVLSIPAVLRGGYIIHAFRPHRMASDFSDQSTAYIVGPLAFSTYRKRAFPITLSVAQSALNAFAMWWFFGTDTGFAPI
jgi:hypothetical protein